MRDRANEDLDEEAAKLDIPRKAFIALAGDHFERHAKKDFPKAIKYFVRVYSRDPTIRSFWSMELPKVYMQSLFEKRMDRIYEAYDELCADLSEPPEAMGTGYLQGQIPRHEDRVPWQPDSLLSPQRRATVVAGIPTYEEALLHRLSTR